MALMICRECGKQYSENASICPNCGNPNPQLQEQKNEKEYEKCDIIIAILLFIIPLAPIGIILMWVKKVPKSKLTRIIATILFGLFFIFWVNVINGNENSPGDNNPQKIGNLQEEMKQGKESEGKKEIETSFEKETIYKGHNCNLKLIEGSEEGFSIQINNNSKKDYNFDVHSMAINGIMTNCSIYTSSTDVPSKKKGIMNVEFDSDWLKGIEHVEYVDFIIWSYDNAKNYKDFETEIIRIKSNQYKKENKIKQKGGAVKRDGLIIQKEKLDTETFSFSVINKNKEFVEFDFQNSSINGWAYEDDYLFDAMGIYVYPNSIATVEIDISDFSETNNLKKIKNIEFSLAVRTKGDYFNEKDTEKIKFK